MKSQINIFFISLYFILSAFTTFSQNEKPINSGAVFIDGKYVEPPYIITLSDGNQVFINGISICTTQNSVKHEQIIQKPVIPNCLSKFSSFEDITDCYLPGQNLTYVKAASLYFIENYDYEIANDSIIEYYKHLPNIESITQKNGPFYIVKFYNGRVCTMCFSVDRLRQLYPKNEQTGHLESIDKATQIEIQMSQIQALLKNNKLLFFFSDENANNFLISDINDVEIINDLVKSKNPHDIKVDSLTNILHNKKLIEKLLNYESFELVQLKNFTTNSAAQDSIKIKKQNRSLKNMQEEDIAYSPKRNKVKAFCPALYETNTFGMFLTQEFENVKTKIENCGFDNPILYVDYTANDNVFACDYYDIKHMADDAGFIYIAAHGGETEGILLTRGTTEDVIINWISDMNDLENIEIANVPDAYKPEEWSDNLECWEAYANSAWANQNWGTELVENKTITILSICNGYNNGWVNACAGGACFGYEGITDFGSANTHNIALLGYMNSSSGNGQYRLASQAYNKVIQSSPTSNLKYIGNGEVTLCPGIVAKFPDNLSIVNSSGNGYIALDTWCNSDIDLDVSSYLSPVSFSTQGNIVISDLEWDNPVGGKSNRINFSWLNSSSQNSGIVTVHINAEKFQSTPSILNEYHTLNPTVEPTSYSFQVNPYDISMPTISGKVYDSSSSDYLTNGTVKDTDNSENSVSINSQGEYSISVNQAWSGSLTASSPGYAPKTQPFNPVFADTEYDFYLDEVPNTYITHEVVSGNSVQFYSHNVPSGYNTYWDFGDPNTDYDNTSNPNPPYTYSVAGTFTVVLTLTHYLSGDQLNPISYEIVIEPIIISGMYSPEFSSSCLLVDVGTEVTFYDNSTFNEEQELWKWFFEWDTDNVSESDFFYKEPNYPVNPEFLVTNHIFNNIGHQVIKLQSYNQVFWFGDVQYNGTDWNESLAAWGGVNVIDCDLTSVLFTHPLFCSGIFLGAVYDDWAYNNNTGPLYIYGGSFLFNGIANNHLDSNLPITISACKEIIINGDLEFIADGSEELILEINDDPCLHEGGDKSLLDIQEYGTDDVVATESHLYCYPNPVSDFLNVSILNECKQDVFFKFINIQGQVIVNYNKENVQIGRNIFRFDIKNFPTGMYFISINMNNNNSIKKFIKN